MGLADGVIERAVTHVIEARPVVQAAADRGLPALDEAVEQRVHPAAIGRSGEGRVLARHTDPGVPHYHHQEACLTVGEPEIPMVLTRSSAVIIEETPQPGADS